MIALQWYYDLSERLKKSGTKQSLCPDGHGT